jgi:hypothetical protein
LLVLGLAACRSAEQQENVDNSTPAAASSPDETKSASDTQQAPVVMKNKAGEMVVVSPSPPPADGKRPDLVISNKRINFGRRPQGRSLAGAISIKNLGNSELKIAAVEPS